jgi:hypothetical protein
MQHFILYKTTNLINNKTYIGIHQTNDLNDGYLGSGIAFKKALKKYGKENFFREIIETCSSFDELLEKEKKYVNESWVNNKNNYNLKTGGQSVGILSSESKNKISETLKDGYASGRIKIPERSYTPLTQEIKTKISKTLIEKYEKQVHHLKNIEPWNKNKTGVQIAWNKDIQSGPMDEKIKNKISNTMKKRISDNPDIKIKQSQKLKEYYKTHIHPTKGLESKNKGKKLKQIECPYCKKLSNGGNAKRWHFENCKFK